MRGQVDLKAQACAVDFKTQSDGNICRGTAGSSRSHERVAGVKESIATQTIGGKHQSKQLMVFPLIILWKVSQVSELLGR